MAIFLQQRLLSLKSLVLAAMISLFNNQPFVNNQPRFCALNSFRKIKQTYFCLLVSRYLSWNDNVKVNNCANDFVCCRDPRTKEENIIRKDVAVGQLLGSFFYM